MVAFSRGSIMSAVNRVWNPAQYLQFERERLRPALDLLNQIPNERVDSVLDLGCGTGNMAIHFRDRWPNATALYLVDVSSEMLSKAKKDVPSSLFPQTHFIQSTFEDVFSYLPADTLVDVIYSNAALQWVAGSAHATLLPRYLKELLKPGGTFAMQLPDTKDQPSHHAMRSAGQLLGLAELDSVRQARTELTPTHYRRLVRPHCSQLNIWTTTYCHELFEGENPVADFFAGSGLGSYLEALVEDKVKRAAFVEKYRELVAEAYPKEGGDGATLLFMKRFFLVATLEE